MKIVKKNINVEKKMYYYLIYGMWWSLIAKKKKINKICGSYLPLSFKQKI